ncbi:uncharacterized protein LOC126844831 [Adelges cooleyi]|uniref:uncharacterized protein LOC126844831 n=1 Tax=Adelges cooleyi TaxID=133065 RepID=UPI00217FF933|nr:uncharacterized protein LOC126844831 [Adelges cooleyi]
MLKLDSETPLPWVIMLLCNIYMIITWGLSIVGAVSESFKLIRSSLIMWTIFIFVWMSLFIWSVFPSGVSNVCVRDHCPESLWLVDNAWQETVYCDGANAANPPADNNDKGLGENVTAATATVIALKFRDSDTSGTLKVLAHRSTESNEYYGLGENVTAATTTVKALKFRDSGDTSGIFKVLAHHSTEFNEYYDDPDNRLSAQNVTTTAVKALKFRDSDTSGTLKVLAHPSTESSEYYDDPDNRLSAQTFESNGMGPTRTQAKKNKYRSQQSAIIIMVLTLLMFFGYFIFAWVILRSYMRCLKQKIICEASRTAGQPCVNEMHGSC